MNIIKLIIILYGKIVLFIKNIIRWKEMVSGRKLTYHFHRDPKSGEEWNWNETILPIVPQGIKFDIGHHLIRLRNGIKHKKTISFFLCKSE